MKSWLLASLVVVAGVCLSLGTAGANTAYSFSGHLCNPRAASGEGNPLYNSSGLMNYTDTIDDSLMIWCGIGGHENRTVDVESIAVWYYDGVYHSNGYVSCTPYVRVVDSNGSGSLYAGDSLYSCGTPGGCSSAGGNMAGYGYLLFTGTELPNDGGSLANVAAFGLFCSIPSQCVNAGIGPSCGSNSALVSYDVEQVNP